MDLRKLNEKVKNLTLNQFLAFFAVGIIVVFLVITLIGFISGRAALGGNFRKADPLPQNFIEQNPQSSVFDLIGQIRSPTKYDDSDNHAVVVITPWLEYDGNDKAFYEELDKKLNSIKSSIYEYIASRTESQLKSLGEENIKAQLLELINEKLILGKVHGIYFKDYEFVKF